MGDINLVGPLDLMGTLTLKDKVLIDGAEAMVVASDAAGTGVPPVILPPPPASPLDTGTDIKILVSFNLTVMAGSKPLVAQGMLMQGNTPMWPGMVLPSVNNTGSSAVKANGLPINVKNDQGVVFPSGGTAIFDKASGQ